MDGLCPQGAEDPSVDRSAGVVGGVSQVLPAVPNSGNAESPSAKWQSVCVWPMHICPVLEIISRLLLIMPYNRLV